MTTKIKHTLLLLLIPFLFQSCFTTMAVTAVKKDKKARKESFNTNLRIVMKNGEMISGNFHLPNSQSKKIKVELEDGERLQLANDDIEYIYAWNQHARPEDGVIMVYTASKEYKDKKNPDANEIKYHKKRWLLRYAVNEKIAVFVEAGGFTLQDNNYISAYNPSDYYLQKAGDDMPMKVAIYDWFKKELICKYLEDCPQVVEKIRNNKYDTRHYQEIIKMYQEYCPD